MYLIYCGKNWIKLPPIVLGSRWQQKPAKNYNFFKDFAREFKKSDSVFEKKNKFFKNTTKIMRIHRVTNENEQFEIDTSF